MGAFEGVTAFPSAYFIIERLILGVSAILSCITNNKCLKHMYLTMQQTSADTILDNQVGYIEFLQKLTHTQAPLI